MFQNPLSPRWALFSLIGVCASSLLAAGSAKSSSSPVTISKEGDKLRIEIDGQFFSNYHYQDVSRPFFYPVIGPLGDPITRDWPMKKGEHDAEDHPHHRSLWYAHGDINGVDFWSESSKAGKTAHNKFLEITSGAGQGVIHASNNLIDNDGEIVATDETKITIHADDSGRFMDWEVTFHASHGDITFGDTKEGTMAIRLAPTMRLKGKVGEGHIVNSEGVTDNDTWGKRAKWCDYYGPVNGKTVGVAIFDHPANPRHPTWWHVRNYGLFAANPFGIHDFERKPAGTGDLHLPAGKSLTFKYRFYFHAGDTEAASVEKQYQNYADSGRTASSQTRIPEDYSLIYQQDFEEAKALGDFFFSDPDAWQIGQDEVHGKTLELKQQSDYKPKVRSPYNIALLQGMRFGDFILEANLRQTGREYGHRDMCLFYNFQDPSHFYYTHIASAADAHAHNIFLVNDAPRVAIAEKTTDGADWKNNWHKVRLERNAESGTIVVFFDDMTQPLMFAKDKHFLDGYLGFGSFDDVGMIDNIKVWAPKVERKEAGFFKTGN